MKSVVVVGAQWGDEGKGKVVDYLAGSFDYIARVAGGHNAGHTVIIGKDRFVLQLIPCGILRPKRHAVIGTGVVVDPAALVAEIETLSKAGIHVKGRLHVSNRAHLIFPYHRELDKAAEGARGANKIGTTSRGIGPAYEDKMARRGLRMCDLLEPELFRKKAAHVVAEKNRLAKAAYGADIDFSHEVEETLKLGEKIRGYICDTAELLNRAMDEGKSVLFEGAQGTMLDIDHGTYPFVTSSSATSFGAVTGRPRRCGWMDLQVLRYAKMINGIDSMVITKLDVFDTQRDIQVCVGYKYKGTPLKEMPALAEEYEHVTPEYKALPGWNETTYGIRDGAKLPKAAGENLRFIADFLQVEIGMISTGPERDATIVPAGTLLAKWL